MGIEIVRKTTCDTCGKTDYLEVPVFVFPQRSEPRLRLPEIQPMPANWALITIQKSEKELRVVVLCPECALETTTQLTRHSRGKGDGVETQ